MSQLIARCTFIMSNGTIRNGKNKSDLNKMKEGIIITTKTEQSSSRAEKEAWTVEEDRNGRNKSDLNKTKEGIVITTKTEQSSGAKKKEWTVEEDRIILQEIDELGN